MTDKDTTATLIRRYKRQVPFRPARHEPMNTIAVAFEPGDQTSTFCGKRFLPFGSPMLVIQSPHFSPAAAKSAGRVVIWTRGYRSTIAPHGATIMVGGVDECRCSYDFKRTPRRGGRGPVLDPVKNPRLMQLALEMDRCRQRSMLRSHALPHLGGILLPKTYLGFVEGKLPVPEKTPGFLAYLSHKMHRELDSFDDIPQQVVEQEWYDAFVAPYQPGGQDTPDSGNPDNRTGHWLLPTEFTTRADLSIRDYEEFDDRLVGVDLPWNPVAELWASGSEIVCHNPAEAAATHVGCDLSKEDDISHDQLDAMMTWIRENVPGVLRPRLTDDRLHEMLTHPDKPAQLGEYDRQVTPGVVYEAVCKFGGKKAATPMLRAVREKLGDRISDCCTDDDLEMAMRYPSSPLYASGMAKVQCLRMDPRQANDPTSFQFAAGALSGRAKTAVDLWSVPDWWWQPFKQQDEVPVKAKRRRPKRHGAAGKRGHRVPNSSRVAEGAAHEED